MTEWQKARRKWYKAHPSNHQGYWICALCSRWTANPDLDHIKKRGSNPALSTDLDNLRPLCRDCHIKRHNNQLYKAFKFATISESVKKDK